MNNNLWTEKYRPKTIEDFDCPLHMKNFLNNAIKNGFPHLLLYGPPGTGKTTFASLLNPTFQLNASDERGIDVIRNKIKTRANTCSKQVIVLDECENLTKDSQTCLRRILEDYHNTTFIFCTNYYSKIIDPLKSRLLKIKFELKETKALERIGKLENLCIDYNDLFIKCRKDLRRCLNVMQGIKPLQKYDLDDVIGLVKDERIDEFLSLRLENYKEHVNSFIRSGYSVLQFIIQLNSKITGNFLGSFEEKKVCEFLNIIADCELKSINGCSDEIVLSYLALNYISIFKK